MEDWSGDLVARWRAGDEQAAAELFNRYASRLIALARSRLPARFAARVEAEDVVQSVYRCFFDSARDGRVELQRAGDLWQLLVKITLHRVYQHLRQNTRAKRNVARERGMFDRNGDTDPGLQVLSQTPSPAEAAMLTDEVQSLALQLGPLPRRVFELRLQGLNLEEIAVEMGCSQRTVRRLLQQVRAQLQRQCGEGP